LHCNGTIAEMAATVAAAGTMSMAGLQRASRALARREPPEPIDTALLEAELEALLKG
jgi:beta-N-acetylhexosaminidase